MVAPFYYKEFCECGGSIHVAGSGAVHVLDAWQQFHSGAGHQDRVTAREAEKIRSERRRSDPDYARSVNEIIKNKHRLAKERQAG